MLVQICRVLVAALRQPIFKSSTRAAISEGLVNTAAGLVTHPVTSAIPVTFLFTCSSPKFDLGSSGLVGCPVRS